MAVEAALNRFYVSIHFEQQESLTQSPAPSKDVEERMQAFLEWFCGGATYRSKESVTNYIRALAAELGKEREAEVATLRAELADRWRDITANEQQTQRLLNDIENLRAEIAELKARP